MSATCTHTNDFFFVYDGVDTEVQYNVDDCRCDNPNERLIYTTAPEVQQRINDEYRYQSLYCTSPSTLQATDERALEHGIIGNTLFATKRWQHDGYTHIVKQLRCPENETLRLRHEEHITNPERATHEVDQIIAECVHKDQFITNYDDAIFDNRIRQDIERARESLQTLVDDSSPGHAGQWTFEDATTQSLRATNVHLENEAAAGLKELRAKGLTLKALTISGHNEFMPRDSDTWLLAYDPETQLTYSADAEQIRYQLDDFAAIVARDRQVPALKDLDCARGALLTMDHAQRCAANLSDFTSDSYNATPATSFASFFNLFVVERSGN